MTDLAGWRHLFVLAAAFGLLVPFASRILARGTPGSGGETRIDWLGGLLFGASVGGALLALTEGSRLGWGSAAVLGYSAAAVTALAALVLRQRAVRDPFVPRALLANGAYLSLAAVALLTVGINVTLEVALPIRLGAATIVAALVLFSGYGVGAGALAAAAIMVAVGVGYVLVQVPLTTAVSLVGEEKNLPSGLVLSQMCSMLGVSVGTALFSAVLAARGEASASVNPLFGAPPASWKTPSRRKPFRQSP